VRTNEGVTGIGECSPMNAGVIVSMLRDALAPIVIGKNPLDIGLLWDEMYHRTYKLGVMGAQPEAMAGIDIALWDILGKVTGMPLWQLMGGRRRERIRLYSSIGGGARAEVREQVNLAVQNVKQGYTALKMRMDWSSRNVDVNPKKDWEIVSTVRKEVGEQVDLQYDANNGLSVSTAIRLGRRFQDELNVIHYEEPIAQHDYAGYAEICAALDMAVAAGEHEHALAVPRSDRAGEGGHPATGPGQMRRSFRRHPHRAPGRDAREVPCAAPDPADYRHDLQHAFRRVL
jgi:L-alanine-DL-glutamate epimerase-like enolase superfamily enzyme